MSIATNFKRSEQNYTELQVVIPELADIFTENSSNPKKLGPKKHSFLSISPENIEFVQGGRSPTAVVVDGNETSGKSASA